MDSAVPPSLSEKNSSSNDELVAFASEYYPSYQAALVDEDGSPDACEEPAAAAAVANSMDYMTSNMKTYTAEGGSRLANMAKQFGFEQQRKPRPQVRGRQQQRRTVAEEDDKKIQEIRSHFTTRQRVQNILHDHSIEAARMRAGYARHVHDATSSLLSSRNDVLPYLVEAPVVSAIDQQPQAATTSDMPEWLEAIEQEEDDLHAHGVGGDLTSAVLGIIKGMVGPAILYLPHGMAHSGYALAIPIMLLVTFLFLFSCQCLLDAWRLEHVQLLEQVQVKEGLRPSASQLSLKSQQSYKSTDTIREEEEENEALNDNNNDQDKKYDEYPFNMNKNVYSENKSLVRNNSTLSVDDLHHHKRTFFLSYPELAYRAMGVHLEHLVKLGITLMQSCVCLTYLIFVPQNLSTAVHRLMNLYIAPEWYLLVMIAIQMPLSWVRDIRKLTVTNLLANLLILYGLLVCIALALQQATTTTTAKNTVLNLPTENAGADADGIIQVLADRFKCLAPFGKEWFLFIGTSVSNIFVAYMLMHRRFLS
jgi:hypothetical protein